MAHGGFGGHVAHVPLAGRHKQVGLEDLGAVAGLHELGRAGIGVAAHEVGAGMTHRNAPYGRELVAHGRLRLGIDIERSTQQGLVLARSHRVAGNVELELAHHGQTVLVDGAILEEAQGVVAERGAIGRAVHPRDARRPGRDRTLLFH